MEKTWVEFSVIGAYLLLLIAISIVFKRLSSNASDYFRAGCKGKWWLVGMSCFMTAFSAWTFTGAAGVAFEAGWSALIIFLANVISFLINAACLAPWFRQLRAISPPEIIRNRYGVSTQQFYAWITVCTQMMFSSVHLYGLAIFSSAVFGFDVQQVILVLGVVVLFYAMLGGNWGVMATDFVQSMVLMPMTILVAILCLIKVGGIGGLMSGIREQGLSSDYSMFNDAARFGAKYTYLWAAAILLKNITAFNSLTNAARYFSVKDGREARKAALLTAFLMFLGSMIWFIPPMTARLLFADAVTAVDIAKPAEAAYAIASLKLLPLGMTGLMVVAIFAATTSSMDSGLNRNAAVFTNDIYPALCRLLGITPAGEGRKRLLLGRLFTTFMGFCIISIAFYFSTRQDKGIFQYMLDIGAMLMIPLMVPLLLGLFFKRVPWWSALCAVSCAFVTSLAGFLSGKDIGFVQAIPFIAEKWAYHRVVFINMGTGAAAFLITGLFWKLATVDYRKQVADFFELMYRPVDFAKEVGRDEDSTQYSMVGRFCALVGCFVFALMLIPNGWGWNGRLGIFFVGAIIVAVSAALIRAGRKADRSGTAAGDTDGTA